MKITLTYETDVTATVDLDTGTVESISVLRALGTSPSGLHGYTHAEGVRPDDIPPDEPAEPFRREQIRKAVEILGTKPHPKWTMREV